MKFLSAVDSYFLSLFEKISVWFMKLTSRSNFFLAKIMFCVVVIASMIHIINRWFPILWFFPSTIFFMMFSGFSLYYSWIIFNLCDKAEKNILDGKMVKVFLFSIGDNGIPVIRKGCLLLVCFLLPFNLEGVLTTKGVMVFKIIYFTLIPAITAFFYFLSVDPPPICKGKIREWIESFAAGFKKLAVVKAEN